MVHKKALMSEVISILNKAGFKGLRSSAVGVGQFSKPELNEKIVYKQKLSLTGTNIMVTVGLHTTYFYRSFDGQAHPLEGQSDFRTEDTESIAKMVDDLRKLPKE